MQLANLLFDNAQLAQYIGERLCPFQNDSWWWLVRSLAVSGYISQELLGLLIERLKQDKRALSVYCLTQITETLACLTE